MKLSAESFRELTTALGGGRGVDGKERRRSERVEVHTRVPLSIIDKGEARPAVPIMVRDVSPRGINIVYPQRMSQGQQFLVQLVEGSKKIRLLCTVMHSRPLSNGLHSVGAEFTCVLPSNVTSQPSVDAQTLERIRNSVLD